MAIARRKDHCARRLAVLCNERILHQQIGLIHVSLTGDQRTYATEQARLTEIPYAHTPSDPRGQVGREVSSAERSLRAVHVIAGLGAAHGGPSYSVPRLCEMLAKIGVTTTLMVVAETEEFPCDTRVAGYDHRKFAWEHATLPILRKLRVSSGLARALRNEAIGTDVVHTHGLWLMPNVYAGWAAAHAKTPLIVAPRGMLSPAALAFSRINKMAFWRLVQGPAIQHAACFHATSHQEYEEIRAFGLPKPVAIVPNGVDLPEPQNMPALSAKTDRVVLSLGRIHPKKGLDLLIRAWAKLEATHGEWRLRIVGPGERGHEAELQALVHNLELHRVSIEPAIYGQQKYAAYQGAEVFVLPTLNENFGMTVAESLASETPVISTRDEATFPASKLNGQLSFLLESSRMKSQQTTIARFRH